MLHWYIHTSDLVSSWSCLAVMIVGVVCAAFRWFHMCHHYDENPVHYYPARKLVSVFFLCQLLNIPFLVRPSLQASVCYSGCTELFIISAFLFAILKAFFKRELPHKHLVSFFLMWLPLTVNVAAGLALTFAPAFATPLIIGAFPVFMGTVSLILNVGILQNMLWILRQIDTYHRTEFSNEADFPYAFAKKLIWLPGIVLALYWIVMVMQRQVLLDVCWIFLSIFMVYYAIIILRPHIAAPISLEVREMPDCDALSEETVAADLRSSEDIRRRVIEIAHTRYLEPHLTRRDIVGMFGFGERTLAGEIITSYGFYDMINALRLEHARRYRELHPNETKESVAINSVFKDRYAMRHAEIKVGAVNPEILDGFSPIIK